MYGRSDIAELLAKIPAITVLLRLVVCFGACCACAVQLHTHLLGAHNTSCIQAAAIHFEPAVAVHSATVESQVLLSVLTVAIVCVSPLVPYPVVHE